MVIVMIIGHVLIWQSLLPGKVSSLVSFSTHMKPAELFAHSVPDQASAETEGALWKAANPSLKTAWVVFS